ncbi:cytochrome P450 1A5-like [Heteronotia binoei]|uniref:cytochrome P450 1A5-like n=1 Tax=Heteronotia binoei TaxID=13085 RepID=UPI00292FD5CB|nr:cytochrome P450 1A5-like [Heteronotia binoei]
MLFLASLSLGLLSATEFLLAAVVFCFILMTVKSSGKRIPRGLRELPGPAGYPLIGSVLEMGKNPHLSLTQMSEKYGDVMKIRIGTRPVLVLSGLETIKQALVKQGGDFMGRPDLYTLRHITDGQSMTFSTDSGVVWGARRKLVQSALRNFASASSSGSLSSSLLEEHVSEEAERLVTTLQQVMQEQQGLDPSRYLVVSVANVVTAMCFGKRYSHDDQQLLSIVNESEEFVEVASSGNLVDFFPLLQFLPGKSMKKFKAFNRRFTDFLQNIVKDHYESFSKDNIRDITDSLIDLSQEKDRNTKIQLPTGKIVNLVNDIFGAGFDTVTTALTWSLAYLVVYPEIQKKIQGEIDETIGRERKPRLSDRPLLPYTEAFIQEMFRHSSFLPFTIPHCTTRDTVLNGYYIPKDMCVFVNQWQVNHDKDLWKDPSIFKPERFLSDNGKEVNKDECEKVLVFGLGKRRCVGETIARWEVFLFLTTLLQELQFTIQDRVTLDMTPRYGLSLKLKRCEHFQVTKRSPKRPAE